MFCLHVWVGFESCKTNMIPILMHQMHISTNSVFSVVLRPKIWKSESSCENCIRAEKILCHEIEPNLLKARALHDGDNPLFWEEFIKFCYFLDCFFYIRIFKQAPKYLATGLYRPSGTYSPPAEASTQGLKWKTNTIPILMHQMRISIN
jgi:hypothetical protein